MQSGTKSEKSSFCDLGHQVGSTSLLIFVPHKNHLDMKKNIGITDRWIRVVAGLAIGAIGIYFRSWWGLVGLLPLATAWIRTCPLYLPFGLSTLHRK
jgi:hypothetical protein